MVATSSSRHRHRQDRDGEDMAAVANSLDRLAEASQRVAELEHKTKRREIDVSTINMLLTRKHADLREARQKVQSLEERLFLDRPSDHEAIAFLERNIAFHKTEVTRLSEEIERHEQALSEM